MTLHDSCPNLKKRLTVKTWQKLKKTIVLLPDGIVQRSIIGMTNPFFYFEFLFCPETNDRLKTWVLAAYQSTEMLMFSLIRCWQLCGRCEHLISVHCLLSHMLFHLAGDNQQRRWKKQINCPTRSGLPLVAGSCHHLPCLTGVYKGHMAWEGGDVPAQPALTHKVVPPPAGRRWMRCVDVPAPAVPAGSGRGRTSRHWLRSLHSMEKDPDWCS